ncbi:MAG: hypothetical protein WCK27_17160 [Verrucomicrobiota bacterium]
MTDKPQVLQELENAISQLRAAQETIRLSKGQIKEGLAKFKEHPINSEEDRMSIAKYLLKEYKGVYGINKLTVARAVLGCSWYDMEARFRPKPPTCPRCGGVLLYGEHKTRIKSSSNVFEPRILPPGWNCLDCAEIPWLKTGKLKDVKSRILRRFSDAPFSLGDYTYAVGHTSMIRIPRIHDYVEPDYPETAREMTLKLEAYLASGDLGFLALPKLPELPPHDQRRAIFRAGNKLLSTENLRKIHRLPSIEIAPKISGPDEPMPFRFSYGIGFIMPLRSTQGGAELCAFQILGTRWVKPEL